jgi:large subunit ribosomal protein L16
VNGQLRTGAEELAREAFDRAAAKLPVSTTFVEKQVM